MSGAENSGPKTRSMPTGPPKKSRYVSRAPGQSVSGGKGSKNPAASKMAASRAGRQAVPELVSTAVLVHDDFGNDVTPKSLLPGGAVLLVDVDRLVAASWGRDAAVREDSEALAAVYDAAADVARVQRAVRPGAVAVVAQQETDRPVRVADVPPDLLGQRRRRARAGQLQRGGREQEPRHTRQVGMWWRARARLPTLS